MQVSLGKGKNRTKKDLYENIFWLSFHEQHGGGGGGGRGFVSNSSLSLGTIFLKKLVWIMLDAKARKSDVENFTKCL